MSESHTSRFARVSYSMDGQGTAVLCIQGVGVAGSGWRPQRDALSKQWRVITFDNPGIGASAAPDGPMTIEGIAANALSILDAERHLRAHVVGHSMGGLIALHIARVMPARVLSLSLLCTFADGAAPLAFSWRMARLGFRARVGTRAMRRNGMLDMVLPADYLHQVGRDRAAGEMASLFGHDLGDQPPIANAQLKAMSRYDARPTLPSLREIPTLVVSGTHDSIAPPRLGRALADGIPGARFVEFAEAGHALPIQCAERLNPLLIDHLSAAEQGRRY